MRHDRNRQRSLPVTLWAAVQIVAHLVSPWRRPSRLRWGARPGEPDPSLPGEDLIPDPVWTYTRAIDIDAPTEDVWPWIAQLGQSRGGFYTFERLENLVGCRIVNADEILPGSQTVAVGDEVRLHPDVPMQVAVVDPGRALVLHGAPGEGAETANDSIWAFHLVPVDGGRCRLLDRGKTTHGPSFRDRLFFSTLLVEPIGFVMGREMLLGIKERAENM